jgi:large subunit ribosomal protein L4
MPTVAIKTQGGGTAGELSLSERVFGAARNLPLMHQAVRAELENRRQDTRQTKGRSDVAGGGRKPFRQKGTGRARQGSISAPHWRHGGQALHITPRDLGHAMPKKMRQAAIRSALSAKLADNELVIVDQFPLDGGISTRTAATFLAAVTGGAKKSLVIIEAHDETVYKSLRNIDGVTVRVAPVFSTRDVVDGGIVVITRGAADKIESQWGETAAAAAETTETTTEAANA